MKTLRIVFAGTPEFTLPCLEAIAGSPHELIALYTQPDRPFGRGQKLQPSPVKRFGLAHQLPVYQPLNFKEEGALENLSALAPDLLVVIAYGLILPPAVLCLPALGCINVHASLLPRWRGASPIQQAILHGDKETGITIMQMDRGLDTGDRLMERACPILAEDTAGSLHDKLAALAVAPLLETLDLLAKGEGKPVAQANALATYAGKIKKEDAAIDWQQPATRIERQVKAYHPWPIAYTKAKDSLLRIHSAFAVACENKAAPGTILSLDKSGMKVATGENQALLVEVIQFPGKNAMKIADFINANRSQLEPGLVLQ
ncbi:MAG: methionyl-tRNA formyltransferase [Tatlockia sp.]|jgi:methionyl-tRNA formyltransferase